MPTYTWHVLFYAVAGNDREEAALAQHLADMATALTSDRCAISAQLNTRTAMTRRWITRGNVQRDHPASPVDTSSTDALRLFINAATKRFDATSTILIMCGHGTGLDDVGPYMRKQLRWLLSTLGNPVFPPRRSFPKFPDFPKKEWRRWGPNPITGTFLGNLELRDAIATSDLKRVDVLAMNACWMGMLEVTHALRDVASMQIATQPKGPYWPYGAIVKALSRAPLQTAEELATAVVSCVRAEIDRGAREDTVAAIRSAELVALARTVDTYAKAAMPFLTSDLQAVKNALLAAKRFEEPHQVDLSSLVSKLSIAALSTQQAAAAVQAQLKRTISAIATHKSKREAQGLSLFCPLLKNIDLGAAYRGLDFASNAWADFLKKWQSTL